MTRSTARPARRILIVDDEPNMRRTLVDILHDEGFEAEAVGSGAEALEVCRERRFDVVVLDVRMPDIDGVEVFRQLRGGSARIILMSAFGVQDLRRAALDEGAVAFLTKPLDLDVVIRLIRDVDGAAVLIVGADADGVAALEGSLRSSGYRVTTASRPAQALALAEQIRFDIAFIDADLGVMSGLDFYAAIKSVSPSTVAIMTSDRDDERERVARAAVRATAYSIVWKPIDGERVLDLVKGLVGRRLSGDDRKPDSPRS